MAISFILAPAIITGGLAYLSATLRRKAKRHLFVVPLTDSILLACWSIVNMADLASEQSSNLYHMDLRGYGMFFLASGLPAMFFAFLAGLLINRVTEEWLGPHVKSAAADYILGTVYLIISSIINSIAIFVAVFFPTMFAIG